MRIVASALGGLVVVGALGWAFGINNLAMQRYFSPKQEAIRRQVFEQSKAYNQGMIQELQNMQFEYQQADKAHQLALRGIILHRAADYDEDKLPSDLRQFIEELKHEGY